METTTQTNGERQTDQQTRRIKETETPKVASFSKGTPRVSTFELPISRFTERTQTCGSIGTHQEQAPGYPYMLPLGHRATITVGATLPPACLTRSNPRLEFVIRSHARRDS